MLKGLRNGCATFQNTVFDRDSSKTRQRTPTVAQGLARSAQPQRNVSKVCARGMMVISCIVMGCSHQPVPERSALPLRDGIEADAAIPSGNSWYVLRLNSPRYLHLSDAGGAWSESTFNAVQSWREIASPGGAFRPVSVISGSPGTGHFYLLDAAQGRLCLYDTAAQLISTFPLPQSVLPFIPGRMEAFRGADGAFTFLDYQSGEALQFADRQGSEGGTDWVIRNRVKLPMGIRDCIQEPGTADLSCSMPDGPARFDASLNRIGAGHALPLKRRTRMFWDRDAVAWSLEAFPQDSGRGALFRFHPARHRLETVAPDSP